MTLTRGELCIAFPPSDVSTKPKQDQVVVGYGRVRVREWVVVGVVGCGRVRVREWVVVGVVVVGV